MNGSRPEARGRVGDLRAIATGGAVLLVAAGAALGWGLWQSNPLIGAPTWIVVPIATAFGSAHLTRFRVSFRGEHLQFALTEIPMAFALVYLVPIQGLAISAAAITLVQGRAFRISLHKVLFNVSLEVLRFGAATAFLRFFGDDATSNSGLILVAVAIFGAEMLVAVVATSLFRLASQRQAGHGLSEFIVASGQSAVGAAFGTWTLLAALATPWLMVLPGAIVVMLWLFTNQQVQDRIAYQDLLQVHDFLAGLANLEPAEVETVGLARLRDIIGCGWLALLDVTGEPIDVTGEVGSDFRLLLRDAHVRDDIVLTTLSDGRAIVAGPHFGEDSFGTRDRRLLRSAADLFESGVERAALRLRLEHDATHDPLTGLWTRNGFVRSIEQNFEPHAVGAILVVVIDRLIEVNNNLGFAAGDLLMAQSAERIGDTVVHRGTVARLDADSFAIFVPTSDENRLFDVATSLRAALERPLDVQSLGLCPSVRIGIAAAPSHGRTCEELIRAAELAVADAAVNQPPVALFRSETNLHSQTKLDLVVRMRRALDTKAFDVWFQPKVDTISNRVVGAEALLRWHDHDRWIGPDQFIPVAEAAGLMNDLTDFVLDESLKTLAAWRRQGYPIGVAVNLSPSSLEDNKLPGRMISLLNQYRIDAPLLTVEITESIMMETGVTKDALERLRNIGVRLSVDDFGTGYSSLRYLKDLEVDELKLDRSFVQDLGASERSETIARAVMRLGHSLGLQVVAEGVETNEARSLLAVMGCDVLQGYLLGRPMEPKAFDTWLANHRTVDDSQAQRTGRTGLADPRGSR